MTSDLDNNETVRKSGDQPDWKKQLVEVLIFFFFFVFTSIILSFFIIREQGLKFTPVALSVILQNLVLVGLVSLFMRRIGEPLGSIGWTFENVRKEILFGLWLFIPFFFGIGFLARVLQALGLSAPSTLPQFLIPGDAKEIALAFILLVVVAVSEETIFRGYLIRRFNSITASLTAAVALSTVIFSIGHGYEGSAGIVITGVMGLIFALVYIRRGSLAAPVVMHFLQNFVAITLTVLLKMKQ